MIAGGPAPLIATALLAAFGSGYVIALYILFCAVVSIIATLDDARLHQPGHLRGARLTGRFAVRKAEKRGAFRLRPVFRAAEFRQLGRSSSFQAISRRSAPGMTLVPTVQLGRRDYPSTLPAQIPLHRLVASMSWVAP